MRCAIGPGAPRVKGHAAQRHAARVLDAGGLAADGGGAARGDGGVAGAVAACAVRSDLERLASRVTLRSATPRECLTLADSLLMAEELREVMAALQGPLLHALCDRTWSASRQGSRCAAPRRASA